MSIYPPIGKPSSKIGQPLDRITPFHVTIAMAVFSAITIAVCTTSAYSVDAPLPPPGPPPPAPEKSALGSYRYKPTYFRSLIEDDAKKLGIKRPTVKDLKRPNAHRVEFTGRQRLKTKGSFSTTTLMVQLIERKQWIGEEGGRFRAVHLIVKITNISSKPIAYRVDTQLAGKTELKAIIPQNAVALMPGESIERTEGLAKRRRLYVRKVEVLEISPLGYHYVRRLDPAALGLSPRVAEGHQTGKLAPCRLLPWRQLRKGLENGDVKWVDVVDFYSRHSCDEYSFFTGYTWSDKGPKALPQRPPS